MTESRPASPPVRQILDENGDLLFRVTEENPGTMFRSLRCESPSEVLRVIEYPEAWARLTDRKLYQLCRTGEPVEPGR
jgi:hypothetical protein